MSELLRIVGPLVLMAVMMAAAWGYYYYRLKTTPGARPPSDCLAGNLSMELGLPLHRGDPSMNLAYNHTTNPSLAFDHTFDGLLQGQYGGVPAQILYYQRQKTTDRSFTEGMVYTNYEWMARIAVRVNANVGRLEATHHRPGATQQVQPYFEPRPAQTRWNDPQLDGTFAVWADDPQLPSRLAPFFRGLLPMHYVHLVIQPGEILFCMDRGDAGRGLHMMGMAYGIHFSKDLLDMMSAAARHLEGRA